MSKVGGRIDSIIIPPLPSSPFRIIIIIIIMCYFDVFLLMVPTTHSNSVVIQTDMYTPRRTPPLRLYPP